MNENLTVVQEIMREEDNKFLHSIIVQPKRNRRQQELVRVRERLAKLAETPTPPHEPTQSKWGWHPCSWLTYQKLRMLRYFALLAARQQAAHGRWERKLPENRVIRKVGRRLLPKPIPISEPTGPFNPGGDMRLDYRDDDYRLAKFPNPDKERLLLLRMTPAQIDHAIKLALLEINHVLEPQPVV